MYIRKEDAFSHVLFPIFLFVLKLVYYIIKISLITRKYCFYFILVFTKFVIFNRCLYYCIICLPSFCICLHRICKCLRSRSEISCTQFSYIHTYVHTYSGKFSFNDAGAYTNVHLHRKYI